MAGRIPQSFIDDLIARVDIVELIGSRVPLKRAGREYKACCPFHNEKTPSFWVSPDKQFYHCFGCGAHGTALGFLMAYDRLSFPEAIEDLAERLGVTVPSTPAPAAIARRDAREAAAEAGDLYGLLDRVATHYCQQLARHPRAQAYVKQRGLNGETLERFRIGYAPDDWSDVLRRFGTSEPGVSQLQAVGLIIERNEGQGHYDRFRDRLMFPIRDTRGRVIGFGGRIIDTGEPKYLNSPENPLFHKGQELYGLHETRLARQALKSLLVVEGYMDVVRLHQAGITSAVATLGTATTPEHLRRAFRLVSEVVFSFDGDRAGRTAAWRALQTTLPELRAGREVRFLFLPEGEDPDSIVGREGRAAFEARMAAAQPLSEYLLSHLQEEADISHADGKARFVALARPLVEKIADPVFRDLLLERMAKTLAIAPERLHSWMRPAEGTPAGTPARLPPSPPARDTRSAGRGSLVTQAIALLLHYPQAATRVGATEREGLAAMPQPGIPVLCALLEQLHAQPTSTMAQTLERWREHPAYARLSELAGQAPWVPDADAAARELPSAIGRLLQGEPRARLDALISKARTEGLDEQEKLEFQSLTALLSNPGRPRGDGGAGPTSARP